MGIVVAFAFASVPIASAHPPPAPEEPDPYLVDYPFVTTEAAGLALSDVLDGSLSSSKFTVYDPAFISCCSEEEPWKNEVVEFVGTDAHLSHLDQYESVVTLAWQNYDSVSLWFEDEVAWVVLDLQVYCDHFSAAPIRLVDDHGTGSFPVTFTRDQQEESQPENGSEPSDQPADCETEVWGHDVRLTLEIWPRYDFDPTLGLFGGQLDVEFLTDGSSFLTVRAPPAPTEGNEGTDESADGNETAGGNQTTPGNETVPDDGSGTGNETEESDDEGTEEVQAASGEDEAPTLPGASTGLAIAGIVGTLWARRRNRQA